MNCSLPPFTEEGLLSVGDYPLTLAQLRASYLVTGQCVPSSTWDRAWRGYLVDNLEVLVRQLWQVDITAIFINGSFIEDKDHPNDINGYFECDPRHFRRLTQELITLNPPQI